MMSRPFEVDESEQVGGSTEVPTSTATPVEASGVRTLRRPKESNGCEVFQFKIWTLYTPSL